MADQTLYSFSTVQYSTDVLEEFTASIFKLKE
jgi:hypothetical protein